MTIPGTIQGENQEEIQGTPQSPILKPPRKTQGKFRSSAVVSRERRQKAFALRKAGASYEQIGLQIGVSTQAAYKMVVRYMSDVELKTREDATQVKKMELVRLDEMHVHLWSFVSDKSLPLTERLQAMDRVFKIMERRAKYEGLDKVQAQESIIRLRSDARQVLAPSLQGATEEELEAFNAVVAAVAQRQSGGNPTNPDDGPDSAGDGGASAVPIREGGVVDN